MTGFLNIFLRLGIWFLLTADASLVNIIIGVCVALIIPQRFTRPSAIKEWLRVLGEILVAIPSAYKEAVEIMVRPHRLEAVTLERVRPSRTPGLIFLDIFLITFTPKTVVLNYREEGWYEVHQVQRRSNRTALPRSSDEATR
ncbi:MAG: Na+/H+ antiporter subunit E [Cyanobacteria bacterium P01_D01_bin.14]